MQITKQQTKMEKDGVKYNYVNLQTPSDNNTL